MFWDEVGNFFEKTGEFLYSGLEKLVNAAAGSFQIEFGLGYGLGGTTTVGPVKVQASAYQDTLTVGIKNGSSYTAIKGGAGVSAEFTEKGTIGVSTEYEHRFETNTISEWDGHTTSSAPWEVYNCPHTVKNPFQLSIPLIKPLEGELSDGLFIGASVEAHIGLGGHFTIGWDANEFWRLLSE